MWSYIWGKKWQWYHDFEGSLWVPLHFKSCADNVSWLCILQLILGYLTALHALCNRICSLVCVCQGVPLPDILWPLQNNADLNMVRASDGHITVKPSQWQLRTIPESVLQCASAEMNLSDKYNSSSKYEWRYKPADKCIYSKRGSIDG